MCSPRVAQRQHTIQSQGIFHEAPKNDDKCTAPLLHISGSHRSPLPPTFLVNSPKFRAVVANSAAQLGAPFRNPIPEILMKFVATFSPTSRTRYLALFVFSCRTDGCFDGLWKGFVSLWRYCSISWPLHTKPVILLICFRRRMLIVFDWCVFFASRHIPIPIPPRVPSRTRGRPRGSGG